MKKLVLYLSIFILMSLVPLTGVFGQGLVQSICSMPAVPAQPENPNISFGGIYKPSTGTLRILVVFIRFKDDNDVSSTWPDPNVLPSWAANIVDQNYSSTGNYTQEGVSHLIYENSSGLLHIIGDVYYVTTLQNESYYHNLSVPAYQKREIIQNEVLNTLNGSPYNVDFKQYDNWRENGYYDFTPDSPDEILDMCWMITRNHHDVNFPAGPLGEVYAYLDAAGTSTVSFDDVQIIGGKIDNGTGNFGSGITYFGQSMWETVKPSMALFGETSVVGTAVHEFSHYLLGAGHFGSYRSEGIEIATKRSNGDFRPYSAHSGNCYGTFLGYEKYRLGWIQPTVISADADNVILFDFETTTDPSKYKLLKIPIPYLTGQFFLIENRQFISNFEPRNSAFNLASGKLRSGLLIYHIIKEDYGLSATLAQIRSAEGRHVWKFLQGENTSVHDDDVIEKDHADFVNGYDERERVYFTNKSSSESWEAAWLNYSGLGFVGYHGLTNFKNGTTSAYDALGDSLDLFQVGDVFTPWSNPGSHFFDGTSSVFSPSVLGLEIVSYNSTDKSYTLKIRRTNPEQLAPSRPQNLTGYYVGNNQVSLSWTANGEPDLQEYKIYRDGSLIGTVSKPATSYTDNVTPNGLPVTYRMKSVDTELKLSMFSDSAAVFLPPAAPSLVSPANGATGVSVSPTLSWNASAGASTYHLQVATDVNFNYIVVNQSNIGATSSSVSLDYNTTYYWRVKAVNASGESAWSSPTWNFTTEIRYFTLTINSPCGLPTNPSPGPHSFAEGTIVNVSVTSTVVSGGSGTQYVFTDWSGAVNSTNASVPVMMDSDKEITANCKTQYELTVNTSPGGFGTWGQGWYDAGAPASACVNATTVSGGSGTQHVFTQWVGDANSGNSCVNFTMNNPKSVTSLYQKQYYLTMTMSGPCGSISPSSGWYNEADGIEIRAYYSGNCAFQGWSGSGFLSTSSSYHTAYVEMFEPISEHATFDYACVERSAPPWAYASTDLDYAIVVQWGEPSGSCSLRFNIYRYVLGGGVGWELIAQDYAGLSLVDYPPPAGYGYNDVAYSIVTVSSTGQETGSADAFGGMYWW